MPNIRETLHGRQIQSEEECGEDIARAVTGRARGREEGEAVQDPSEQFPPYQGGRVFVRPLIFIILILDVLKQSLPAFLQFMDHRCPLLKLCLQFLYFAIEPNIFLQQPLIIPRCLGLRLVAHTHYRIS